MGAVKLRIVSCLRLEAGTVSCWRRKVRVARRVCLIMGESWMIRLVMGVLGRLLVLWFRGGFF